MAKSKQNEFVGTAYARAVVAGEIPAGELARLACERHLRDLKRGRNSGYYFDQRAAERAIDFFAFLKHSKGEWAGRRFELEPWQLFIIGCLFGWKNTADGLRRFRKAYIELPRKNGKSTLGAGIGMYLFVADGEPGAEVYTAATKRDQAKIVHSEATRMVKKSPTLRRRVHVTNQNLSIEKTSSKYEPLGADGDTMDGLNVHGAIIDEIHAHKTRDVVDVLDTATGSRRQPLIVELTTAGYDRHSICWEEREHTAQVLRGTINDPSWFGIIYGIDEGDDWRDPKIWAKANPNYGVSVKPQDLERKSRKALEVPAYQNTFRRLHLDQWTRQESRWLDINVWDETAGALVEFEQLKGRDCFAGLDLASTTDLASLNLIFPPADPVKGVYITVPFFWIPGDNIEERGLRDRVPYREWVDAGLITATEGNVIHYDAIRGKILELQEIVNIRELAFDRWGATQLSQQLDDAGLTVIPFGQGYASMSPPTKQLLALCLERRLRHGGNPVLRWMADNMVVKTDPAANVKPDKEKSTEKIDGMVAMIMALDRADRHEERPAWGVAKGNAS